LRESSRWWWLPARSLSHNATAHALIASDLQWHAPYASRQKASGRELA
jgi:hypothetical protein